MPDPLYRLPRWDQLRRWLRDWVANRGGLPLAVIGVSVLLQVIPLFAAPQWLGWAMIAGIVLGGLGTASIWLRAVSGRPFDHPVRIPAWLMAASAVAPALAISIGPIGQLAGFKDGSAWYQLAGPVGLSVGPLSVIGLLLWPPDRGRRYWGYLAVDLAVIGLAVGLYFWYFVRGGPNLATEVGKTSVVWAAMVAVVSVAILRGSARQSALPFMLAVLSVVMYSVANFGIIVADVPDRLVFFLSPFMSLAIVGCNVGAAEAVRLGWKWPWADASVESTSPVPWVAVGALALLVARIGLESTDLAVGPVVMVTIAAMALLVIRQMIAMRHNSRLQAVRAAIDADIRIAALVRHTSDVILIADQQLTLRYAAPSAEALWSRTPVQLLGTNLSDLVDPPSRADFARVLSERLAQPGQTDVVRVGITGPEGTRHRIEAVVISLLHEPTVHGIVVTLRDLTERILLEEQLGQSQKMEAIGQLAGGVAHDFNNLLTTIVGHSEMAADLLAEDHPVRDDLIQITRASELAASLTRQLLIFSRKQVIEPRIIDPADSIQAVTKMVRRLIKADVAISLEVSPALKLVRVDPAQLEQVVLNLAVNARDAMPDGGRITIRATQTVVKGPVAGAVIAPPLGECTVIEVIDVGTGMDPATQARIFEPFFTTKPAGRGTGLGLATVYGAIKQNGGGLVLTSEVGKGTTFAVYLARVEAELPSDPGLVKLPKSPARANATILLVEDETGLREIATKILTKQGYRVLVAADGDDALMIEASSQFRIDLLLTDVVMPGMSGPVLAGRIKAKRPDIRVLLMSGYPGDDLTGELRAGENFLRKPFTPFVLLEHVRGVLDPSARPPSRRPGQ